MFANTTHSSGKYGSSVGHNYSPNAYPQPPPSTASAAPNIPPQSSGRNSEHNSPTNKQQKSGAQEVNAKPMAANNSAANSGTPTAKNVSERVVKANLKISDNPYDIEAWNVLIKDAQNKRIDDSRDFFERLVSQFPNSGRFWKLYIETEVVINQIFPSNTLSLY
ncbi:unnamed protein product, partial [Medioppia subpectinata]